MKSSKIITRVVVAVLIFAMAVTILASCGSKAVMTLEIDGKKYTVTESEYSTFMTVNKMLLFSNNNWPRLYDQIVWTMNDTFESDQNSQIRELMEDVVVEKYLLDKYGLSLSAATLAGYKENIKKANNDAGGPGAFKQYYGYTAKQLYDYYQTWYDGRQLLLSHLYTGANATDPVTDEERETYYKENYKGYMYIYLDMNNKLAKVENPDGDDFYIGLDSSNVEYKLSIKINDEDNVDIENLGRVDGKEVEDISKVEIVSLKTEALTDEEKEEKSNLPDAIIADLDEGKETFKELMLKYSDDYVSYLYENGFMVNKDANFISNTDVMTAVNKLEVGEYTSAIGVEESKKYYIVNRIELAEKPYADEDGEFADLFTSFEDLVIYEKFDTLLHSYKDKIVVDEKAVEKFKMSTTFLSKAITNGSTSSSN
ncbi:MAG: hypothetical protein IJQ37_06095 [Clostridia bacterium]|nr:hypothetical protein [Clostridia bacterium]